MDCAATRTFMEMRQIKRRASREGLGMIEMNRLRRAVFITLEMRSWLFAARRQGP